MAFYFHALHNVTRYSVTETVGSAKTKLFMLIIPVIRYWNIT